MATVGELVAVTGATGFIGSAVRQRLLAQGWSVRALTRRAEAPDDRCDWIHGDLEDDRALDALVEDAVAVIHCAGTVRGGTAAFFERTNVQGTAAVVRAAARHRPWPRLLFLSSLAARRPELSWYARSKRLAEEALTRNADAMPWAVLRPTAVHGPGDREMQPLFDALSHGVLPVPGRLDARLTLLHVRDLADAVVCWLQASVPARGIFELHDGTEGGYDWQSIAQIAAVALDRPVRRLAIPGVLLHASAWTNLAMARLLGYSPMLTPGKVRELRYPDWRCDNSRFIRATGWYPQIRLSQALRTSPAAPPAHSHH